MQTAINQKVEVKERDGYREQCFKDAHKIEVQIRCTNVNDENWDWIKNELRFRDNKDNLYSLIEFFKEGKDNSTDYVNLEYLGSAGIIHTERFHTHKEAEDRMVVLMRNNLNA